MGEGGVGDRVAEGGEGERMGEWILILWTKVVS